ncbi:MAG: hypothetical protein UW41_C0012G0020 [Candidatus Collierbacteria bacterium GW2011_GWC2_44_18]|uniref:Plasmid stabilization system n=1 Tax=Candidatus Collierbacteria bacterium GW2011_GWC2_44_18 TaxID=1618392 RepID=A0A0G1JYV2_9BACT|nr:MAG: hypothetical protein UW16_C0031G0028 [Microgenomates group bacterium GW2011_GWC1_44_10]KKT49082.1 MAG: hypothetical protein UW41_C0012G0020 [Candidatus Collierbacteria bacterium GW2011_GWC2_44_18]
MEIKTTLEFRLKVAKLCRKNKSIGNKIDQKLRILSLFPNHPSLRLHKLQANNLENWSISIDKKNRIIFIYQEYGILLINIGSHDQVY